MQGADLHDHRCNNGMNSQQSKRLPNSRTAQRTAAHDNQLVHETVRIPAFSTRTTAVKDGAERRNRSSRQTLHEGGKPGARPKL